ncbi:MAG TPA: DUF1064 domain-containing protein [Anaerovoracaceae bacterium]|nr:DUF1064 domain-containing protein [Anaerovoracaceae bacterium]
MEVKRRFLSYAFVQRWETIGGKKCFFKSTWEINYARWLEWLKEQKQILDWEYEPDIFRYEKIKRGTKYYVPDFKVRLLDGSFEYHEVKGYMDQKSRTKLKRFLKYFPQVEIKLVSTEWFKRYKDRLKAIITDWI